MGRRVVRNELSAIIDLHGHLYPASNFLSIATPHLTSMLAFAPSLHRNRCNTSLQLVTLGQQVLVPLGASLPRHPGEHLFHRPESHSRHFARVGRFYTRGGYTKVSGGRGGTRLDWNFVVNTSGVLVGWEVEKRFVGG